MSQEQDHDEVAVPRTIGYGGIVVRDGIATSTPDHEALRAAVPQWLATHAPADQMLGLLVDAARGDDAELRLAAVDGLAQLHDAGISLGSPLAVQRLMRTLREDPDARVAAAAARLQGRIERPHP
ncbi:MAG: hypothetical protein ACYC3Q_05760 [Gemmatimonadaceae bacterium]